MAMDILYVHILCSHYFSLKPVVLHEDMNIPASGVIALFVIAFLRLQKPEALTRSEVLKRIDIA